MESWPNIQYDTVLLCRHGYFLALRSCLYIRTEIKVKIEPHELRFIVLKVHYLGSYSWTIFPLQKLMNCPLAYMDLNQVTFRWASRRLLGLVLSIYNWRRNVYHSFGDDRSYNCFWLFQKWSRRLVLRAILTLWQKAEPLTFHKKGITVTNTSM